MALTDRTLLFNTIKTDLSGNVLDDEVVEFFTHTEPDFLDTELLDINLPSVDRIEVSSVFEYRPDLLSYKYFGNYHLGWLIAYHNQFLDMVGDLYTGRIILIPDLNAYYKFFNRYSRAD